jgi:hypothetical protein
MASNAICARSLEQGLKVVVVKVAVHALAISNGAVAIRQYLSTTSSSTSSTQSWCPPAGLLRCGERTARDAGHDAVTPDLFARQFG